MRLGAGAVGCKKRRGGEGLWSVGMGCGLGEESNMAGKGGTGLGVGAREGTGEQRDTDMTRTFGDCHLLFAQGGLNWQCRGCAVEDGCT